MDHGKTQSPQWVESLAWSSHGSPNGCFVMDYQWLPVDWNRGTPVALFQDTFISTSCPPKNLISRHLLLSSSDFIERCCISSWTPRISSAPNALSAEKNDGPAGFFMVVSSSGACPGVSWDGAKASRPIVCWRQNYRWVTYTDNNRDFIGNFVRNLKGTYNDFAK